MVERRRMGRVIVGVAAMGALIAASWVVGSGRRPGAGARVALDAKSPLGTIAERLKTGDAGALAALFQRVTARPQSAPKGLTAAEGEEWLEVLAGLRAGYPRFSPYGRETALTAAGRALDGFAVDPAPASWDRALQPMFDLMTAGLADEALNVRMAALREVARLWSWLPGTTPTKGQEEDLARWKDELHAPVVRRLADPQPTLRAAAVACLAALPINEMAAPAVAYLDDPDATVRAQVIAAFAARPDVLADEAILARLGDRDPRIPPLARDALKARHLTDDQIALGALIAHPRPEMRVSVIPMLDQRTDIDPVVWLVRLSRDPVESVRMEAVAALAARKSPEAQERLEEMALHDASAAVRKAAGRAMVDGEATAALPPLPGSPSLTPKAN